MCERHVIAMLIYSKKKSRCSARHGVCIGISMYASCTE